jgi:hypothetical protein
MPPFTHSHPSYRQLQHCCHLLGTLCPAQALLGCVVCVCVCVCVCLRVFLILGFALAKQVLYHLIHSSSQSWSILNKAVETVEYEAAAQISHL